MTYLINVLHIIDQDLIIEIIINAHKLKITGNKVGRNQAIESKKNCFKNFKTNYFQV